MVSLGLCACCCRGRPQRQQRSRTPPSLQQHPQSQHCQTLSRQELRAAALQPTLALHATRLFIPEARSVSKTSQWSRRCPGTRRTVERCASRQSWRSEMMRFLIVSCRTACLLPYSRRCCRCSSSRLQRTSLWGRSLDCTDEHTRVLYGGKEFATLSTLPGWE
jgi:hypothetical protein